MTPLFRVPTSVGKMQELFRQIRQNIAERTIADGPGYRTRHGPNGYHIELIKKPAGSGTSSTSVSGAHPFQIYSPTTGDLTSLGLSTTDAWRKFFVRCGRVNEFKVVDGTDRSDYPDDGLAPQIADFPFGHNFSDILIEVPASTAKYYVWLEIAVDATLEQIAGAYVWHGLDPVAEGWDNWNATGRLSTPFNDVGQYFMMIGEITTTASTAKIRQLVRADVQKTPGAMLPLGEYAVCVNGDLKYAMMPSTDPTTTQSR